MYTFITSIKISSIKEINLIHSDFQNGSKHSQFPRWRPPLNVLTDQHLTQFSDIFVFK